MPGLCPSGRPILFNQLRHHVFNIYFRRISEKDLLRYRLFLPCDFGNQYLLSQRRHLLILPGIVIRPVLPRFVLRLFLCGFLFVRRRFRLLLSLGHLPSGYLSHRYFFRGMLLQKFLHALRQLLLKVKGVKLAHVHGFDLDIFNVLARNLLSGIGKDIFFDTEFVVVLLLRLRARFLLDRSSLGHNLRFTDITAVFDLVIFHLLLFGQGLVKLFQLKRLEHVFPFSKPQEHLVTFFNTLGFQSDPVIEIGKLIRPLLTIVSLFKLLENRNPLFQADLLRLIKLILKNVPSRVLRRQLHKFFVVFNGLHIFFQFDG